jgi:hypothetical protein
MEMPKCMKDLFRTGTVCQVLGAVRLQDNTMKAQLEGLYEFTADSVQFDEAGQIATGTKIIKKSVAGRMDRKEATQVLELFIGAKPYIPLDEEANWWNDLKTTVKRSQFTEILRTYLHYSKSSVKPMRMAPIRRPPKGYIESTNRRTALLHNILMAGNSNTEIQSIKKYLQFEIRRNAQIL